MILCLIVLFLTVFQIVNCSTPLNPPPWPEWILKHWVWEHEEFTTESGIKLVQEYLERDIPVGATIIDSGWQTKFNTFNFNPERYPNPKFLVDTLHSLNVKVIFWITSMINKDSPDFQFALQNNFLLSDGAKVKWWHGKGAFLDYTNPDAVKWWHGLMDKVLSLGIDGWKVDGTDPFTKKLDSIYGNSGTLKSRDYTNLYYRDFFHYTREVLGNDRIILARPYDSLSGIIFYNFAPLDVNFAGWVGDQDPTFSGLNHALANMFASAKLGYINFGSDIGGFGKKPQRDKRLFLRWAQLGALCPIMENGGNGEHRPWKFDEETLSIYRKFVKLHHSLIPYLYSQGASAYERKTSLMKPFNLKDYFLGDSLFISPITEDVEEKDIFLPEGEWIDFWTHVIYKGNHTVHYKVPLDRFPIFVRNGSIIPFSFENEDLLTIQIFPLKEGSFDYYQEKEIGATISYTLEKNLTIEMSSLEKNVIFLIENYKIPNEILVEKIKLTRYIEEENFRNATMGWFMDFKNRLWIKPGPSSNGLKIYLQSTILL